jgi:hypothetical protein
VLWSKLRQLSKLKKKKNEDSHPFLASLPEEEGSKEVDQRLCIEERGLQRWATGFLPQSYPVLNFDP